MPTTKETKKENIVPEKQPKVEFEKLTYSDNKYESDDYDEWVPDQPNE